MEALANDPLGLGEIPTNRVLYPVFEINSRAREVVGYPRIISKLSRFG